MVKADARVGIGRANQTILRVRIGPIFKQLGGDCQGFFQSLAFGIIRSRWRQSGPALAQLSGHLLQVFDTRR